MRQLYNCLKFALDCLAPHYCRVCRHPSDTGSALCAACAAALPIAESACPRCALPGTDGLVCGRCQARAPSFDAAFAPCRYAEPVASTICALKYGGDLTAARLLGQLLADGVSNRRVARPDLIVPVPLHPRKIMQRGFNQSIEIGKVAAKRLDIPLAGAVVRRTRHTPAQQSLSLAERRRNVRDAFLVARPPTVRRIALVDDVMTSGATLDALARALKCAGDYEIHAWACARA